MAKLLTILFLIVGISAHSATYYVDYTVGSDAGAGTSTGAAWKHCPGDPSATGTAASATLTAGDTVVFKGGVTNVLTGATGIALSWSGTPGSPITYDGNSAGTWGTGRPVITDSRGANNINAFIASVTRSNLVFYGFEFYGIGGTATLPTDLGSAVAARGGAGITFSGFANSVVISNCWFHELGYYFNQKPMDANSISGSGVAANGCNGLTITNCEFSRMMIGCEMVRLASGSISNLVIAGCKFHDSLVWCIDMAVAGTGTSMDNTYIHHNQFYDYYQFDQSYWTGYGGWPHTDGIFDRCDYNSASFGTNNCIYANQFWNSVTAGGGTASIYVTDGPSVNIYNNTFVFQGKSRYMYFLGGPWSLASAQVVNVFNNTILTDYTQQEFGYDAESGSDVSNPGVFREYNNIFYDTHTGSGNNFIVYSTSTNTYTWAKWDYNLYKTFNNGGTFWDWTKYGEWNLTGLRGNGWETNGLATDPLFTAIDATETNYAANNLRLFTNSPAIAKGTNLTSWGLPGITSDIVGSARPASGAWDLGAYQYSTGGGSNTAPSISIQPQSQSVSVGASPAFTVTASGTGPLAYQWTLATLPISGATTSSYTTNGVVIGANGNQYAVVITNSYGSVTSAVATLTVLTNISKTLGGGTWGSGTY